MKSLNRFLTESTVPEIIKVLEKITHWKIDKINQDVEIEGETAIIYKAENIWGKNVNNSKADSDLYIYVWHIGDISFVINGRYINLNKQCSTPTNNPPDYDAVYSVNYLKGIFIRNNYGSLLEELSNNLIRYFDDYSGECDFNLLKKFELIYN